MLEYQQEIRKKKTVQPSATIPSNVSRRTIRTASHAARSLASGMTRLSHLARSLSGSSTASMSTPDESSTDRVTEQTENDRQAAENQEDEEAVDAEMRKYEVDGVIDDDHPEIEHFDLLRFWQVHFGVSFFLYPLLMLGLESSSPRKQHTRSCGNLPWTSFLLKPQQYLVNESSHQAKRLILSAGQIFHLLS